MCCMLYDGHGVMRVIRLYIYVHWAGVVRVGHQGGVIRVALSRGHDGGVVRVGVSRVGIKVEMCARS